MTFGEKRNALRRFKVLADGLRAQINARGRRWDADGPIAVSTAAFDDLELGLSHVKVWVADLDEEGERIPGTARLVRANFLYRRTGVKQENLMFKGVTILRGIQ